MNPDGALALTARRLHDEGARRALAGGLGGQVLCALAHELIDEVLRRGWKLERAWGDFSRLQSIGAGPSTPRSQGPQAWAVGRAAGTHVIFDPEADHVWTEEPSD